MKKFWVVGILKCPYYLRIQTGLLILNWVIQRLFRINASTPFSVHYTSKVSGAENMILSETAKISFAVSNGAFIKAFEESRITIGEGSIFANNVTIHTGDHDFFDREKHILDDIHIGDNCWLGSGVSVLKGVRLGNNVTVGANSVVTKSFPDNCVLGGCPAVIIKIF